jgi:hypothetical protein
MTKVQEQCTIMVYSAAFWAAVRGEDEAMAKLGRDQMSEVQGS